MTDSTARSALGGGRWPGRFVPLAAGVGILIIGLGVAFTDAEEASPEWWTAFLRMYLYSIIPFCISFAMIARRTGRSLANGLEQIGVYLKKRVCPLRPRFRVGLP